MKNEKMVQEWLRYAKSDADSADFLYKNQMPRPLEIICFHCQQAAEKNLKALLVGKNIPFDRKHDLVYLIELNKTDDISIPADVYSSCERLTQHGISPRYPGGSEITEADTKLALSDMDRINQWVKEEFARMETQS